MIEIVNKEMFDELISNEKTIIMFYTKWCPICKILSFSLEEYQEEHSDIVIGKVDINDLKDIACKYEVTTYPYTLFFEKGILIDKAHGKIDNDDIDEIFYH